MTTTLPVSALYESPTNPRKHWDKTKQAELEQSIEEAGVLQALLVRDNPQLGTRGSPRYEVIHGSRRLRAAVKLELGTVPVDVRSMSDAEVLRAQQIENLQREDLHPLDEAEGFKRLVDEQGMSARGVAAAVGRPVGYVLQRLKLCALVEDGRAAFLEGVLTAATALIVARIPDETLQAQAVAQLRKDFKSYDEPPTTMHVSMYVQRTFMLRLKDAPFRTDSAELVPAAGACSTCPKRTGAQSELFADIADKDDRCTDVACFESKRAAAWAQRKEQATAKGQAVIENPAEVKALFPYGYSHNGPAGDFVALTDRAKGDPKDRTYKQLLGAKAATAVVQAPDGKVLELVPKATVKKLLKEAGHVFTAANTPSSSKPKKKSPGEKLDHETEEKALERVVGDLVGRVEKLSTSAALQLLARLALELLDQANTFALNRRGLERMGKPERSKHYLKGLSEGQARGLVFEALMSEPYSLTEPQLLELCKELGVNVPALTAQVRAELEPKNTTPPAAKASSGHIASKTELKKLLKAAAASGSSKAAKPKPAKKAAKSKKRGK